MWLDNYALICPVWLPRMFVSTLLNVPTDINVTNLRVEALLKHALRMVLNIYIYPNIYLCLLIIIILLSATWGIVCQDKDQCVGLGCNDDGGAKKCGFNGLPGKHTCTLFSPFLSYITQKHTRTYSLSLSYTHIGDTCEENFDCDKGLKLCVEGKCAGASENVACSKSEDCAPGLYCTTGDVCGVRPAITVPTYVRETEGEVYIGERDRGRSIYTWDRQRENIPNRERECVHAVCVRS